MLERFGPFVANTHSESNTSGTTMTLAYREAHRLHQAARPRRARRRDHHAGLGDDRRGEQAAAPPRPARARSSSSAFCAIPRERRPVVFVTHMEHHSNQTSWEESICEVEVVPPDERGLVSTRRARTAAAQAPRPAAEDRRVHRVLQRHRHPDALPRTRARDARARRPLLRRLRRVGPVRRHRHASRRAIRTRTWTRSTSRRTSSSAGRARPACWCSVRASTATACPTSRAAARCCGPIPGTSTPSSATSRCARTAARRRSSRRSRRRWPSA